MNEAIYRGNGCAAFYAPELLPCPFCGGNPQITFIGNEVTKSRKVNIKCQKCRAERTDAAIRNSQEWVANIAISRWNLREAVE